MGKSNNVTFQAEPERTPPSRAPKPNNCTAHNPKQAPCTPQKSFDPASLLSNCIL